VITGFNTDIEHDGVVYHVQTEDKGLDSPIILSLVYSGGRILASKRAPYNDLLTSGFNEAALAERLKRQHTLICAAIHSGRIEDLKRMAAIHANRTSSRTEQFELTPGAAEYTPVIAEKPKAPKVVDEIEFTPAPPEYQPVVKTPEPEPPAPVIEPEKAPEPIMTPELEGVASGPGSIADAYTVHDSRRQSPLGDLPFGEQRLVVSLLDDKEFHSGMSVAVRVKVCERTGKADKPLHNVAVSLKILGTSFRPQIYTTKTEGNGVATVAIQIPEFTSGRAAVLIRAVSQGNATEIRRVVHPGQ
jgi:hypothetical protein